MTLDTLRRLIEEALGGGHDSLDRVEGSVRLSIRRQDVVPTADTIASSMFGMLHLHPEAGAPPFVSPGDEVSAGQPVGLIEAMKSFCPVVAERAGRIAAVLAEHGAEVVLGQPLFRLE